MTETKFMPEIWSAELLKSMRANIAYGTTRDEYSRKGHSHVTPYTDAQLQARGQALTEWQRLTDELLADGHLEYGVDGELVPNDDTGDRTWVYDETEAEHAARVAQLPERGTTVRIPVFNANSVNIIEKYTS